MTHAVAFGRTEVVGWLRDHVLRNNSKDADVIAHNLAMDFVHWTGGEDYRRRRVLEVFQEDWQSFGLLGQKVIDEFEVDDKFDHETW